MRIIKTSTIMKFHDSETIAHDQQDLEYVE